MPHACTGQRKCVVISCHVWKRGRFSRGGLWQRRGSWLQSAGPCSAYRQQSSCGIAGSQPSKQRRGPAFQTCKQSQSSGSFAAHAIRWLLADPLAELIRRSTDGAEPLDLGILFNANFMHACRVESASWAQQKPLPNTRRCSRTSAGRHCPASVHTQSCTSQARPLPSTAVGCAARLFKGSARRKTVRPFNLLTSPCPSGPWQTPP
jgi:hypothetical protein